MMCSLVDAGLHFWGAYCHHHQGVTEAVNSSETSFYIYQTTAVIILTVRSWNLTIHTSILSLSILNIYPSEYYNNSCSLPVRKWAVVFSCSGNTDNHITTRTDLLPYSIYGLLLTVQRMQLTHIPLVATTQDSKQQNILHNFLLVFLVITCKPSWNTGRIKFFQ
jgi:hypothetical protein